MSPKLRLRHLAAVVAYAVCQCGCATVPSPGECRGIADKLRDDIKTYNECVENLVVDVNLVPSKGAQSTNDVSEIELTLAVEFAMKATARVHALCGITKYSRREYADARKTFRRAFDFDPDDRISVSFVFLSAVAEGRHELADALKDALRKLTREPGREIAPVDCLLYRALADDIRLADAIRQMEPLLGPDDIDIPFILGEFAIVTRQPSAQILCEGLLQGVRRSGR